MRKYLAFIILLLVSISLAPFSSSVKAENENLQINTFYTNNIQDYVDLTGIDKLAVNNDNIAYSLDNQNLNIYNLTTKTIHTITGFSNITFIKYVENTLLVVDNNQILIVDNLAETNANDLKVFKSSLPAIKGIDIYNSLDKIYIGFVYNETFELLVFDNISENATPVQTKTFTSSYYENTFTLALNNNTAYIVFSNDVNKEKTGICILDYKNEILTIIDNFVSFAKYLDYIEYHGNNYLITFSDELLVLLNTDGDDICSLEINTDLDLKNNSYPISSLSCLDSFDNKIYVSAVNNKSIQTIKIDYDKDTSTYSLKSDNVVLCSYNTAKGRFNNANNIFIQGNNLIISDTENNRIQILENDVATPIYLPKDYIKARNIIRDSNNNIYLVATNNGIDKILKYTPNDIKKILELLEEQPQINTYNHYSSYSPQEDDCKISSLTIKNDIVFGIDFTNDEIFYQGNNSTITKCRFRNSNNYNVNLSENSQILYLKKLDNFVILNKVNETKSIMYLLNGNCETISELEITHNNTTLNISCGIEEVYLLNDNKLEGYIVEDNKFVKNGEIVDNTLSTLSNITFDSINRQIYGFDKSRQCIVYFDCELIENPFTFTNFANSDSVTNDSIPYIHTLGKQLVYSYPYELGECYNNNYDIDNVIAIDSFDNYNRVLFNIDNTLKVGYIHKDKISNTKLEYEYNKINVITIQQLVSVYKYPTSLIYKDNHIITTTFPIGSKISLTHLCPASIDGKTFYVYRNDDKIGFISSADIILDDNNYITNLNTENASIKLFNEDSVAILDEDKTTIIYTLQDKDRIYVENYDKHSTYTKVIYKDKNQKTYEGYILTENIKMDKLDTSKIILISLIIVSIVIVLIIIISYISIKKKK